MIITKMLTGNDSKCMVKLNVELNKIPKIILGAFAANGRWIGIDDLAPCGGPERPQHPG